MFPEFSKDPSDSFHVTLSGVFGINQDVIKVYNDKNIKFFCKNLVDVSLEAGGGVGNTERHNLILKMAVTYSEGYFPFVILSNSHSLICIHQVQFSKTLGAT